MARPHLLAVEMVAVGIVLGMGALSGYRYYVSSPRTYPLSCVNAEVDLGTVWQTSDLEVEFRLQNRGRGPISVDYFRKSCGNCTEVTPESLTLAAGETGSVRATFDLTQTPAPADKPQEFMQTVTAVAEVGGEEIKVPMVARGTMKPAYRLSANRLDLGAVLGGETVTRSVDVEPLGSGPYDELEILSVPDGFAASVERVEGGKFRLTVTSPPGLQELIWQERVGFRAVKGREPFAAGTVPLAGRPLADLLALPDQVYFDAVPPGEEWVVDVRLLSRTGRDFALVSVESPRGIVVEAADGGAHEHSVRFRPESTDAVRGTVTFTLRVAAGEEEKVRVPVTATVLGGEPLAGGCATCGD